MRYLDNVDLGTFFGVGKKESWFKKKQARVMKI